MTENEINKDMLEEFKKFFEAVTEKLKQNNVPEPVYIIQPKCWLDYKETKDYLLEQVKAGNKVHLTETLFSGPVNELKATGEIIKIRD